MKDKFLDIFLRAVHEDETYVSLCSKLDEPTKADVESAVVDVANMLVPVLEKYEEACADEEVMNRIRTKLSEKYPSV